MTKKELTYLISSVIDVCQGLKYSSGFLVTRMNRGSLQRYSIKKDVSKNFAKFTEKHLCHSLFF